MSWQLVLLEIDLEWPDEACERSLDALPQEIKERAARYLSSQSRRNLIASRTRLREVLEILGLQQSALAVAGNGRPYLEGQSLQFNLSHSHHRAVLALSRNPDVLEGLGVDIEWLGREVDVVAIGRRFFTPAEHAWVGSDRRRFFHVWTRKEAILKSNGIGLRVALDSFDVLTDAVADHVTGRPLSLSTEARPDDYLISYSICAQPARVHLLSDRESGWQERLSSALTPPAGKE